MKTLNSWKVQEIEVKFKPSRSKPNINISSDGDIYKFLCPLIKNETRELLMVLSMNINGVVGFEIVAEGTSMGAEASPREIFKAPLLCNAESIIIAHNHPSGNVSPSEQDIEVCRKMVLAGKILDILVVDFIILTGDGGYSFKGSGELDKITTKDEATKFLKEISKTHYSDKET